MTDDVITLDVAREDILWQMLSCCGIRINCQSYRAVFKKNASKDSGRFFMIIVIYFYSYHYPSSLPLLLLLLLLLLLSSSHSVIHIVIVTVIIVIVIVIVIIFSFVIISLDFIFLLSFQTKDKILSSMAEVNVTDISEATQLTTIAVLATQERGGIPLKTLASTKLIVNSLQANRASHFSEIHFFRNVDTNLLRRTRINKNVL